MIFFISRAARLLFEKLIKKRFKENILEKCSEEFTVTLAVYMGCVLSNEKSFH